MTNVIITRHFSGFANVEDTVELGNSEHEGNAAASVYALPEGYTTQNGFIYDCNDVECFLYLKGSKVMAESWNGPHKVRLVEVL